MRVLSRFFASGLLPILWFVYPPNGAAQVVTATVTAGMAPEAVAVNTVTNKIYVANFLSNNVTVIDGATNSATTVTDPNATSPNSVAVNSATNTTTTVTDPSASYSGAVAVNSVTNKIYVANANDSALTGIGSVTIIDGATNTISNVRDPNAMLPYAVARFNDEYDLRGEAGLFFGRFLQ